MAEGIAATLTGSAALLAETLHTVADAGNEVLLYVAIRRSRHPADASHPFGYGPERYYWALLAAIGMFVIGGAVSVWDGIQSVLHPRPLDAFAAGVAVLVIALVLDGASRMVAGSSAGRPHAASSPCARSCARRPIRRSSRSSSKTRSTCSARRSRSWPSSCTA
jgi:cation diffusion facilitator family transporter